MRVISRVALVLVLLGGPFACGPKATDRATNAAIGGLFAFDLNQCIEKHNSWSAFDQCEAALRKCALEAKTVGDYDVCSDKVTQ